MFQEPPPSKRLDLYRIATHFPLFMPDEAARDDELFPLLEYFAEKLNLVFSHFFCTLEFEQDEDLCGDVAKNARTWSLKTIQNACLHTTLIALRDLDDFLTPRMPQT
jgi:hypothetical protein